MTTLHTVAQRHLLLLQLTNSNVAQVVSHTTHLLKKILGILEQTWKKIAKLQDFVIL